VTVPARQGPRRAVVITGGGTGGHVVPALAIAEAIVATGTPRGDVHYVGSERGLERDLVPPTGFPLTLLPGRGIQRRLTLQNLTAALGLAVAALRALVLVGRLRPRVVVAVGGYASVAVALAAVVWRIPLVVAEQNVVPGAANRLLGRFAKVCAVAFDGTPLPRAVVTGNPVRAAIAHLAPDRDRAVAKAAFGVDPGRRLVLVFGGSLGALRLNRATVAALARWAGRADLTVHHAVGERDWAEIEPTVPDDTGSLVYRPVRYEHDMPAALAAADLAVCRAGSGACFELLAASVPAVLVPSEVTTAGQQVANARAMARYGAAVVVADGELDGDRLAAEVIRLLDDPGSLASMAAAATRHARPDAAAAIAQLAERWSRA
jgi:UDP-N-acetylglucosamine--N-acetylmuramyl-(pentapeptide) pyrophosphoryl-undecaprenol N-acetylglucosamine transferase